MSIERNFEIPNSKHEKNSKHEIANYKLFMTLGFWVLELVWSLVLGI